ncbi:MAG: hypothetical protein WC867_03495 [Candidatus Pacearchaeota archaeon]|jgi:hypothetical protein
METTKRGYASKVSAATLTIIIISILIISGPAQAFTLAFENFNSQVNKGDKANFSASIDFESNEKISIDYLILRLNGPVEVLCKFYSNGTTIEGCDGINISQIVSYYPTPASGGYHYNYGYNYGYDYGYNYGYGYGNLKNMSFNITLDTNKFMVGIYKTSLSVVSGDNIVKQDGSDLQIYAGGGGGGGTIPPLKNCSIRAKNGIVLVEDQNFSGSKAKINFYIPEKRARNSQGYITAQAKRMTFSYKFKVQEVIRNDEEYAVIKIDGKYKLGIKKYINENATIVIDKKNNRITVDGNEISAIFENVDLKGKCLVPYIKPPTNQSTGGSGGSNNDDDGFPYDDNEDDDDNGTGNDNPKIKPVQIKPKPAVPGKNQYENGYITNIGINPGIKV